MPNFIVSFWKKNEKAIISVSKGAAIASLGAGLTYALGELGNMDFGQWTPTVVAALSVGVNIVRKFGVPLAVIIFKGIRL